MQEGHQAMRGNRVAEDAAETLRETASCHHVRRASRFSKVVGIVDTSVATVTKGGRAGRKLTADKTTAAWPCDFELHAISQAITTYGVAQGLPRKGILWQESKHRHGKFSRFIGGRERRRGGGSRRPWSSTGGGRQVAVAAGPGRRRARQGRQVAMAAGPGRWRARQGRLPRYWPLGGLCGSRCVAL